MKQVNTQASWNYEQQWCYHIPESISFEQAKAQFAAVSRTAFVLMGLTSIGRKIVLTGLIMSTGIFTGCTMQSPELKRQPPTPVKAEISRSALLAFDISGSRSTQRERQDQATVQLLRLLKRARVGHIKVVIFSNERQADDLTVLYEGNPKDIAKIREAIAACRISRQRGTHYAPVLQLTARQKFDLLFLESDGGLDDIDATTKAITMLGAHHRIAFLNVTEYRGKLETLFKRLDTRGNLAVCGPNDWIDRCEQFLKEMKG